MSKIVYGVPPSPLLHGLPTLAKQTLMPPNPFSPTLLTWKAKITHSISAQVNILKWLSML